MATAMLSARAAPSFSALSAILPRLSTPMIPSSKWASIHMRQLALPLLPKLSWSIPAITLRLPSLPSLQDIWDGLLKAVPKKKVSHSRRRHRQMAGKALKDLTELCRCPGCGGMKRMHYLCPTCAPKYANMMADLMDGSKPKKTASLSKMSEVTKMSEVPASETTLYEPDRTKIIYDIPKSQTKGAQQTINKK